MDSLPDSLVEFYGSRLRVAFLGLIRQERAFSSLGI